MPRARRRPTTGSRSCSSHPSGSPTPAASWIRLTTPALRSWQVWLRRRRSTRRSTSQRSTSSNRRVRNSRCSTACRSGEVARRNAWNRPWGSIATWVNWVQVIPSRPVTSCPASSSRLVSATHSPSRCSSTTTWACTRVVPVPRRLGRSHAGERVNRKVRAPTLARSTTRARPGGRRGRCAGGGRCAGRRGPRRRSAKQTASSTLVLPAPVSPVSRNSPTAASSSKSTSHGVDERPEGRDRQLVEAHQPLTHGVAARPRGRDPPGSTRGRSRSSSDSAGVAGRPADVADEVERDLVGATGRGWPGAGAAPRRRSGRTAGRGRAGSGPRSRSIAATGPVASVSVACTQASSCTLVPGSVSRSSRVPSQPRERRGHGGRRRSARRPGRRRRGRPARSPCTWSASENE